MPSYLVMLRKVAKLSSDLQPCSDTDGFKKKNSRLFCFNLLLINFSFRTFSVFTSFSVRVLLAPLE